MFFLRNLFLILIFIIVSNPLLCRETIIFNDGWSFRKGPFYDDNTSFYKSPLEGKWSKVEIPHTWNGKDMQQAMENITSFKNPQDRFYTGEAFYKKTFTPETTLDNKRVFLKFEGVGSVAEVFLNNQFVGRHKGAYSAFVFEISHLLKINEQNEIIVRVNNEPRKDVIPVNNVLFGVYGGIYRNVELIITDKMNFTVTDYASPGIYISQSNISEASAEASVRVKVDNKYSTIKDISILYQIHDMDNSLITYKEQSIKLKPQGRQEFKQNIIVDSPRLWQGVEDPYLYKLTVKLISNGKVVDEIAQPLGFRHFEFIENEGMYLNGKKYPMYGVCRHQDWLDKGSALTKEEHDMDFELITEIGATTIRLSHYQQAEYVYSKCDSIGLLVWAEIPFVNQVTTYETENSLQQLTELIKQNYNHPSIYIWGLHNEVYTPFEQTIPLTNMLHDLAKSEDPGRYTVSVSGYNNVNAAANNNADIQGINHYFGWYNGKMSDMENWVYEIEKKYPNHRVIFSEYGGEANIFQQKEEVGEIGDCCGFNNDYNETWGTKFHEYHWGVISNHPYILASYVWNMFDFATPLSAQGGVYSRNMKGLVTFDRKVKKDGFYWYKANWSKEPVLYLTQRRANKRENDTTTISIYSNIGVPELKVNNEVFYNPIMGNTNVHYIFNDIVLKEGQNLIETTVIHNKKEYTDTITWSYSADNKVNGKIDIIEREEEHIGLQL